MAKTKQNLYFLKLKNKCKIVKTKISNALASIKIWYSTDPQKGSSLSSKVDYWFEFIREVVLYGIMISFMLWQLLGYEWSILSTVAIGVLYYMIRFEVPEIILHCVPTRKS